MEPVEGPDRNRFKLGCFQQTPQAGSYERGFVWRYIREKATKMPFAEDLRIKHVWLGEAQAAPWLQKLKDLGPGPLLIQVVQNGRANDGIERSVQFAIFKILLHEPHSSEIPLRRSGQEIRERSTATISAPDSANMAVNMPVPQPISITRLDGPISAPSKMRAARRLARSCPAGVPHPQISSGHPEARYFPCSTSWENRSFEAAMCPP